MFLGSSLEGLIEKEATVYFAGRDSRDFNESFITEGFQVDLKKNILKRIMIRGTQESCELSQLCFVYSENKRYFFFNSK